MNTQNAKYSPPKPKTSSMNAPLPTNDDNLQEEPESEEEDLHDPIIMHHAHLQDSRQVD